MPGYKGHIFGGLCAYGLVFYFLTTYFFSVSYVVAGEWLVCTLLGALFPDIDTMSKGRILFFQLFSFLSAIFALMGYWYSGFFLLCIMFCALLAQHRGLFHRWWFILFFAYSIAAIFFNMYPQMRYILWYDAFFFSIGALSHVYLDVGFKRMMRW